MKAVEGAYAGVAKQSETVTVATERVEKRQLSLATGYERLQRQLDGTYRAQSAYERVLRDINRYSELGYASELRRGQLMDLAAQKYGSATAAAAVYAGAIGKTAATANDNFTKSAGLARHEMVNLSRQAADVGTMLAMGQSPFAILASQGAQVADIFATTSASIGSVMRQIGGGALRFATSGAGMATGAAALGAGAAYSAYAYAEGQKAVENALRGVGAASGATLAGINRLAEAEAAAAKVSIASAREIASAYAGTGKVDPTRLPGLIGFSRQYAAFQNIGVEDAMKELAGAFADPSRGAEMLAGKLGGLSSAALRWIQSQQAAGNMLGAQTSLMQTFAPQIEGATGRTGLLARAWESVKRAASDADEAMGKALNGPSDADRLASLQQQYQRLRDSNGPGAIGINHQLRLLEAQIKPLEAIVELQRQREAIDARAAKAANASLAASAIADQLDPYRKQIEELTGLRTKLEEARKLNPLAPEYDEWGKALDRIKGSIASLLPTVDRERQAHDLTMRAISARTLAERTAIEVAREGLRLSGDKVSAAEREIAMQRKAAEVQAQATRDAQDALRASRDRLALAGKSAAERSSIEIEQRYRDNAERYGGVTAGMPATTAAANGLDAAFAESLRKLMAAVPGLGVTSGFRTYEQQAKLYAEKGPGWAARPGTSNHEFGVAADLNYRGSGQLPAWIREEAAKYGIHFPLANRARNPEPWHAEPIGARSRGAGGIGVAAEIRRNDYTERDRNAIEASVGSSNRELQRQFELLGLQRQAWGQSAQEVARAAKEQELINQLQRDGVAIGPTLYGRIKETAAGYGELVRQQEELRKSQEAMRTIGDMGRDALRGIYSDLRNGATGAEAMTRALDRMADKLMEMALNDLFKPFGGSGQGLFGSGGFFSGVMSFFGGGGSGLGMTPGSGGLYASGGYTGPGGKYDPAGIVHRGEYVFSAASVGRIGLGNLDSMHRSSLKGYADGGYVSPAPYLTRPSNENAAAGAKVDVKVVNQTGREVEGSATTKQNPDGSIEVMIDLVEARIADRMLHGQGSVGPAMKAIGTGRHWRG